MGLCAFKSAKKIFYHMYVDHPNVLDAFQNTMNAVVELSKVANLYWVLAIKP